MRYDFFILANRRYLSYDRVFVLYQDGAPILNVAVDFNHIETVKLLLDKGADIKAIDPTVSSMILEIVTIACVICCVIIIMICNGSVIAMSMSTSQHKHQH